KKMYLLRAKYHFKLSSISSYEGGGIFVTQAGPVGIFSHTEVFSSNYNTLRQLTTFADVATYTAHIPSYVDIWGWVMLNVEEIYLRMRQRIKGENRYMDGKTFSSASTLSKVVRNSVRRENGLYLVITEDSFETNEINI
ncbi:hypothetical protein S83_015402, partial [Arachis hypogaea]